MTALHQFGAEMLKLSRGLDAVSSMVAPPSTNLSSGGTTNYFNTELATQQRPLLAHEPLKIPRERNRYVDFDFMYFWKQQRCNPLNRYRTS